MQAALLCVEHAQETLVRHGLQRQVQAVEALTVVKTYVRTDLGQPACFAAAQEAHGAAKRKTREAWRTGAEDNPGARVAILFSKATGSLAEAAAGGFTYERADHYCIMRAMHRACLCANLAQGFADDGDPGPEGAWQEKLLSEMAGVFVCQLDPDLPRFRPSSLTE